MITSARVLLLLLCLLLTGIAEGKKKGNNNYKCITKHLCECGEKDVGTYEECWLKLEEATIDYGIEKVKTLDMCLGFKGKIEKSSFKDFVAAYCALPPEHQKACYDDTNKEMMNRMKDLTMSIDSKDHEEREALENAAMCAQPYIMNCRDSMTECL